MSSFWAQSDTEKLLIILKIMAWGFGYAMVIVPAIILVAIVIDGVLTAVRERRERKRSQQVPSTRTYATYTMGIATTKDVRRKRQDDETMEFFSTAGKVLENDYR